MRQMRSSFRINRHDKNRLMQDVIAKRVRRHKHVAGDE